jgi:Protein of unknown function (DUF2490)
MSASHRRGIAVAHEGGVTLWIHGGDMRRLARRVWYLLPAALVVCSMALAVPCAAQDGDVPTAPVGRDGRGSIFAPSAWTVLAVPVQPRVSLKLYGFYIGELNAPVAQVDVPVRATKFLTITPSYMYYSVPPSGLNTLAPEPLGFRDSYDEQQFRIDATVAFSVHKLEISGRNMYVRRFRPSLLGDVNRYRGRISVAHPIAVQGHIWKPFASYETYADTGLAWDRDRIWTGVTVPIRKHLAVQPSYLWERSDGSRDINYVLVGLIVSTR